MREHVSVWNQVFGIRHPLAHYHADSRCVYQQVFASAKGELRYPGRWSIRVAHWLASPLSVATVVVRGECASASCLSPDSAL